MAELHLGVTAEIALQLLPGPAGVLDFFAAGADGQQAVEPFCLGQGGLQFPDEVFLAFFRYLAEGYIAGDIYHGGDLARGIPQRRGGDFKVPVVPIDMV